MTTSDEQKCVDNMIQKLKNAVNQNGQGRPLGREEILWLLERVTDIFLSEPTLLEVCAPVAICGDIHGQYRDLLRLYQENSYPPRQRYIFLGDYVDRGPQNLEVICLQFALKVRWPKDFYLLRGNHESRAINRAYGFYEEIARRYDAPLWETFNQVFDRMPLAGLVACRILCMHGGISPELTNFDQIREIKRPVDIPDFGLIADLLWADPDNSASGFVPSSRGISYQFGRDVLVEFCETLGLDMVARAHQVVPDGYEFFADNHLITIFSAPDYCDQFTNAGGIMCVEEDLTCKIRQLQSKYANATVSAKGKK